ncbi:major facilitator superfamily domain-containing protein [Aspergillus ambiguus]|uniref:putative MFS monocarboxylate transporter n=1 Tax=Aspergillus ambiguus TaxID=176160 RepID=UPI003CCD5324
MTAGHPLDSHPNQVQPRDDEKDHTVEQNDTDSDNFVPMAEVTGDEENGLEGSRDKDLTKTPTHGSNVGALASRTLSLVRTRESGKDVGPPPDGGFKAWSQVALGHFVIFNTWGYINSFGVFQNYYTESLGRPPSDISWVGSIQIFLLFFVGTFSGRATDAGYFKAVLTTGALLELFCIFMTSLSTQYWQLFLAQGIGQGLGCGLMFCPTIALIPTYFTKKRAIAMGLVASGSATGGLVFPAVVMRLLPRVGYGWTMRTLGFISLGTLIPCLLFLKQRLPPRRSGPLVELSAFKELPYLCFATGMFLNFWGIYVSFFYIGSFARNIIGVSQATSIDVLLVMNGVGFVGRLIPNLMADLYTGPLNMLIPFSLGTGVVAYCWAAVHDLRGLYIFSAFYGLFAAGIQSLFPATLSTLTTDLKKTGVRMGMVLSVVAVAALIGSPIAGALIQRDDGEYLYAQMFMGSAVLAATITLTGARLLKLGVPWSVSLHPLSPQNHSHTPHLYPANPPRSTPPRPSIQSYFIPLQSIMAPRGRGKFSKPSRGGGKRFSRDVQPVDKDGNAVSLWRDPDDGIPSSDEDNASTDESSSESADELSQPGPSSAAASTAADTPEMTREERRAAAKAKKQAAIAKRNKVQPGDLPPSDSEESSGAGAADDDGDEDDLPANPNHTAKSRSQLTSDAAEAPEPAAGANGRELSRREREAIEAQQARERYMKLHAEGKTEEARADLARLAIVREQREAERARKEAEKEEKAELAKQRAAELQAKLAGKGGKKKGGSKKK